MLLPLEIQITVLHIMLDAGTFSGGSLTLKTAVPAVTVFDWRLEKPLSGYLDKNKDLPHEHCNMGTYSAFNVRHSIPNS